MSFVGFFDKGNTGANESAVDERNFKNRDAIDFENHAVRFDLRER